LVTSVQSEPALTHDVVVIGAGLAGLIAARDLCDAGVAAVLLEAKDRLGGRTMVRKFADTDEEVEFGGGWILPDTEALMMGELARYQIGTDATAAIQSYVSIAGGRRWTTAAPAEKHLSRLRDALEHAPATADSDTDLESFLRAAEVGQVAHDWVTAWARYWMAANPDEVSTAGSVGIGIGIRDIDAYSTTVAGGTRCLVNALAADVGEIRTASKVMRIESLEDHVIVTCEGGERLLARLAIVAVPINVWRDIEFAPGLGAPEREAVRRGHAGHSVKFWAMVRGAPSNFRAAGVVPGGNAAYVRTQRVLGDLSLVVGFGWDPQVFDASDVDEVQEAIRCFFPQASVTAVDTHAWCADPQFLGTWWTAAPGMWDPDAEPARSTIEHRLLWAGSDVADDVPLRGSMEGAIQSGRSAARAAARALLPPA
jgi:monoamine oxidase